MAPTGDEDGLPTHAPAVALVLAAGHGRRLGTDKAALRRAGRPVLEAIDEQVASLDLEPVYSLRPDQRVLGPAGRRVLHDRWAEAGPLGGIATALATLPGRPILALAVDMPDLGAHHLRRLLEPPPAAAARCFSAEGSLQPLPSLWLPECAAPVIAAVEAGRLAVAAALVSLKAERIPIDARVLTNVNTPTDLGGSGLSVD